MNYIDIIAILPCLDYGCMMIWKPQHVHIYTAPIHSLAWMVVIFVFYCRPRKHNTVRSIFKAYFWIVLSIMFHVLTISPYCFSRSNKCWIIIQTTHWHIFHFANISVTHTSTLLFMLLSKFLLLHDKIFVYRHV